MLNIRVGCATAGGCSACKAGTDSLGPVCGMGDSCTGGFSSTTCAAGCACASRDAFVLLFRGAGAAFGSLGSDLRGFLVFFSGSGALGSLAFGFGPGFLRGWPFAVRPRGAGDAVAGVGVLVPTPTPPAAARIVAVGVPSGECGGELRLPGEDASSAMAPNTRSTQSPEGHRARLVQTTIEKVERSSQCERRRRAGRFRALVLAERVCRLNTRKSVDSRLLQ